MGISVSTIRFLLGRTRGTIATITFNKVDGSKRVMQIHPAAAKKYAAATIPSMKAKQSAATRKANNPTLENLWEVGTGWRSAYLEKVTRIATRGWVYFFSDGVYQGMQPRK